MLTKRIIPCLDVKDGRVVKGKSFVALRDAGDPVALAEYYYKEGADELTFLDITASVEERDTFAHIVESISEKVFIPLTVGGGIRTIEDVRRMLRAGADKTAFNTAAINNPKILKQAAEKFGSQCIVIAIDAKRTEKGKWEVYTHGGRTHTGIDVLWWAKEAVKLGAGEILLTSMDADGHKEGYDIELTRAVSEAVNVPVIASGGAGRMEHLYHALEEGKADAVLAASIFHFSEHSIKDAKDYLSEKSIAIRR